MKTELRVLFYSPIAWLILIIFAVQSGMTFSENVRTFYVSQVAGGDNKSLTMLIYIGLFRTMLDNLYLYVPLLTMGLMSRELGSGSIKLLYSSPVSNSQIILGKYFSMLVLGLGFVLILVLEIVGGYFAIENFDIGMTLIGLLGFYLTFCAYAAIGLFMSTITQYQVVAAMGTLAVLAVLSFIGGVGQDIDFIRDITWWLSVSGRTKGILEGIIGSADILYFLLVILLFLTLAVLKLRGERTRSSGAVLWLQYGGVIVVVLLCGYLTSRPVMMAYYDATQNKQNTLSVESREFMKGLKEKLTLVTYVNYLDMRKYIGMPAGRIEDLKRFEKYRRFKPDMEMKYVYYYHHSENSYLSEKDRVLDDRSRMEKMAEADDFDPKMFLSYDQLKEEVNLADEDFRFVRRFEYENGKKAFLRIFDDMKVHPFELEISSALKTLVEKSPVIAFSTGHGEKSPDNTSERGYSLWAKEPGYRQALINRGFTVVSTRLDSPVDDSVDVLVLADLRHALTELEMKHLADYLEKGGNLLLIGENRRQAQMNPVAALLGLKFSEDFLVQPSSPYQGDWVMASLTGEIADKVPALNYPFRQRMPFAMPTVLDIETVDDKGFEITDVLRTPMMGVWNEKQTVDFLNATPVLNPETGESEQAYVVAKYLTRQMGEKEQRILVFGDADWLTPTATQKHKPNMALVNPLFELLTYNRFPVQVTLYPPIDNKILLTQDSLEWMKKGYVWFVPVIILLLAGLLWFGRRKK